MILYEYTTHFVPADKALHTELNNLAEHGWRVIDIKRDLPDNKEIAWIIVFERVLCEKHDVIIKGADNEPTCRLNGQKCLKQPKLVTPANTK